MPSVLLPASEEEISMNEKINETIETYIRPLLKAHGGDMEVLSFEDGIVRFKLTGVCAGCAAADLTSEALINKELKEHVPEVKQAVLVNEISDELLEQARKILGLRHE